MKKMNYKKPLAEVMDLEVADILTTSGLDGQTSMTLTEAGLTTKTTSVNDVDVTSIIVGE